MSQFSLALSSVNSLNGSDAVESAAVLFWASFSSFGETSKALLSFVSSVFSTGFTFTFNSISFVEPSEKVIVAFTVFSPASVVSAGVVTSSFASCGKFVTAFL